MSPNLRTWYDRLPQLETLRDLYGDLYSNYWSVRTAAMETVRRWRFPHTVNHISGPKTIDVAPDELIVVCPVRNGAPYIDEFVDHYRTLGARHIVFLDNGSTDATVERARAAPQTTVLRSHVDYSEYQKTLKRYLIDRFGGANWVLCADIDEFFDYPASDRLPLRNFLRYLNDHGFNAVPLQMLDMLPGAAVADLDASASLRASHVYYDLSNISTHTYTSNPWLQGNILGNSDLRTHRGGVRQDLFDMRPDRPLLTKHTLVRLTDGLDATNVRIHHVDDAFIADVSCVLYHYKFNHRFREYAEWAVEEEMMTNDSEEYRSYLETLQAGNDRLATENMARLDTTNELVEAGFLCTSGQFDAFVRRTADT